MPKVVKVNTPGSYTLPNLCSPPPTLRHHKKSVQRGRPIKAKERKGSSRKTNYRSKYSQESLDKAIEDFQSGKFSLRSAAKEYGVPKTTLENRVKGKSTDELGRPKVLSPDEENVLVERLMLLGDWGFPLTNNDFRHIIKVWSLFL